MAVICLPSSTPSLLLLVAVTERPYIPPTVNEHLCSVQRLRGKTDVAIRHCLSRGARILPLPRQDQEHSA